MMQRRRTYVDFEPFCKWNKGEESDIIEIHVRGFKKDQLRVQVNSLGSLLVSGERQAEDKSWTRFNREFKLSNQHCLNSIHAKLGNGVLHVIVPRKDPVAKKNPPIPSPQHQSASRGNRKPEPSDQEQNHRTAGTSGGEIGSGERVRMKGTCWRLGFVDRCKVMKAFISVIVAMAIGVGAYLACKYLMNRRNRVNQSAIDYIPYQYIGFV